MKIDKLFVLSKNKMLLKAIEIACKNAKRDCFVIDDYTEGLHFIRDMRPTLVVIDIENAKEDALGLLSDIKDEFKVVILSKRPSEVGEFSSIPSVLYPVNPTGLWDRLEKELGDTNG